MRVSVCVRGGGEGKGGGEGRGGMARSVGIQKRFLNPSKVVEAAANLYQESTQPDSTVM